MSHLHPDVPSRLRALCRHGVRTHHQASSKLGVTALELMPVHYFLHDRHLVDKGCALLGIQHAGILCREPGYASNPDDPQDVIREFKEMVKALPQRRHRNNIGRCVQPHREGNHAGPTLSFRGIDNLAYYRTVPGDPRTTWISRAPATR